MKSIFLSVLSTLVSLTAIAQANKLPLKEWGSNSQSVFVLYISGDGGFNNFSIQLCNAINKAGYAITAINAKSYFWDKKTPGQTATDITAYLSKQFQYRKNQQWVLAGYSFGADVIPFIVNNLPDSIKKKLNSVVMLAPSTSTDFEIHWTDIFGSNKKRSMDVIAEINKMVMKKIVTIFGSDENNFPVKNIKLKNYINNILPGGHHFDGHTDELAKTMIQYFKG